MRAKNTNKMRQFSSLLNEHWKRKQRLKGGQTTASSAQLALASSRRRLLPLPRERAMKKTSMIDLLRTNWPNSLDDDTAGVNSNGTTVAAAAAAVVVATTTRSDTKRDSQQLARGTFPMAPLQRFALISSLLASLLLLVAGLTSPSSAAQPASSYLQSDPRPTIYSGQVSFGLLLSAHSSHGAELSTSASYQANSLLALDDGDLRGHRSAVSAPASDDDLTAPANLTTGSPPTLKMDTENDDDDDKLAEEKQRLAGRSGQSVHSLPGAAVNQSTVVSGFIDDLQTSGDTLVIETLNGEESSGKRQHHHSLGRRQIFERTGQHRRQQQQQQPIGGGGGSNSSARGAFRSTALEQGLCSQVNPNALYAGMGAIWASHQANLVGDSHLAIGTYVYDSCNDLDVGQRQSVRIVSNLNAFQQTTCESPRGSPISLTIAHSDNQLRAIQLLTSFRVPVITTKEHFALEEYSQLSREQQHFLFTTAPSSRHLALGALRFTKRIVSRSTSSPNLPNQYHKMSSRNGLIVISRNLPARFITFLTETIPNYVNYEMLQSNQPIDQIRSVEALESILIKNHGSSSAASEPKAVIQSTTSSSLLLDQGRGLPKRRLRRQSEAGSGGGGADSDSGDLPSSSSGGDFDTAGDGDNSKMLSPTILMFITPSEAIDLVTRLRNDLAETSRYYSLIVATREDISPALKTIFHRGGSRLCSGKAFYTISPKPDDIGEFSRYFRDTVQMEGETSDHPLVCEFAKHQAASKMNVADLDDISTEPVIKAVWSAAAAFKSVHRRECGSVATSSPASNVYRAAAAAAGSNSAAAAAQTEEGSGASSGRVMNSRQANKAAHSECLVKMNKNMSNLVQRALKRLDVTINSTGLQSLDGFRLKFDEMNELMTNKFSIKYINKECEMTEMGQFSGFKGSMLRLDEESLVKSLESTMPEAWPAHRQASTSPLSSSSTSTTTGSSSTTEPGSSSTSGDQQADNADSVASDRDSPLLSIKRGKRKHKGSSDEEAAVTEDEPAREEDDDSAGGGGSSNSGGDNGDKVSAERAPRRTSKRSKTSDHEQPPKAASKKSKLSAAPVTAMGGRGIMPGLTDTTADVEGDSASSTVGSSTDRPTTMSNSSGPQTQLSELNTESPKTNKPMRKLKPFPTTVGTTLKDWLPSGVPLSTEVPPRTSVDLQTTKMPGMLSSPHDNEQVDGSRGRGSSSMDLKTRATTQSPVYSTLPESGGNADLELTPKTDSNSSKLPQVTKASTSPPLDTASTSESSDYVSSPSISKHSYSHQNHQAADIDSTTRGSIIGQYLRDLNTSPVPLINSPMRSGSQRLEITEPQYSSSSSSGSAESKDSRSRIRSHLKWIYGSWFALGILGANICGALLTLYVLTFLLMKNCDGSLDRDNQGIRSMHLLAIIVVFFGSTLFIVYPTPGLCLLRTSWHNFALVLLFGSLLLQTMQERSLKSLGLGGRPNRLNQFLTLVFMVGVQVSFELQRWKYESANYLNFVNQHFGSSENGDKKLIILSSSIADQFNPFNSFNDQATPVSIQVSEQYQKLLQDYCMQQADDFLQSQIYICIIVTLLVIFSITTRNSSRQLTAGSQHHHHHQLTSALTSGKLVASQHEANLNLSPSHFQFASHHHSTLGRGGNVFMVTLVSAPTYLVSIVLHMSGQQHATNRDLIFSVTMVLIAFAALIGIFLPILLEIHRFDGRPIASGGTISTRPVITQSKLQQAVDNGPSSPTANFAMFPEFTPTGLRRPASTSGESSGAGSRRPFAETKESRRNMSAVLANLGPSEDTLRSLGFLGSEGRNLDNNNNTSNTNNQPIDPALLNLKLNLSANEEPSSNVEDIYGHHHHHHHHHQSHQPPPRRVSKGEKRLIMLDVDPCCPRHGIGAWPRSGGVGEPSSSKNGRSRASHSHM